MIILSLDTSATVASAALCDGERLLAEYRPTMLLVEHDVRFCEQIGTKTVAL